MCAHSGCTAPTYSKYTKWCLAHKDACAVDECPNSSRGQILCATHRTRQRKYGTTTKPPRRQPQRTRPYQINLLLSKGEKDYASGEAEAVGMSMSLYLRLLLQNDMSKQGRA